MQPYITIGLIFTILSVTCYWGIKILCDKKATDYFNANMKDNLQNMFNGYKTEIVEHLDDMKKLKEFKDSKILILNDQSNTIHNISFFANFHNKKVINEPEKVKDINQYSIIIINASNDDLENWSKAISKIDNNTPLLIYTNDRRDIDLSILQGSNKIYTPVNNKFTLIDRLYTSYLIKKISGDHNDKS